MEYGDCSSYSPNAPDEPLPSYGGGTTISGPGSPTPGSTPEDDVNNGNDVQPIPGYKPKNPIAVVPDNDIWPSDIILNAPAPGDVIQDINDYLKCFNSSSGGTVSIYVDQPIANSRDTWTNITDPDVGHTFISIKQGNITRVLGYYPSNGVNPYTSPSDSSALIDDSGHDYDVKVDITVTAAQLSSILNATKNRTIIYNLNTYNCTDFGSNICNLAGFTVPNTDGSWPGGGGSNPGDFGQDLRAKASTGNAIVNKTGGTALLIQEVAINRLKI
jgi:hypothetical protein